MRPLRIAVDGDGTLLRLHETALALINFRLGTSHKPSDVDCWDWFHDHGLNDDFFAAITFLDQHDWRRFLPPYDSTTLRMLRHLVLAGHQVTLLSCNDEAAALGFEDWLEEHRIDGVEVRCLGRHRPEVKLAEPFDVWVDDATPLAVAAKQQGKPLVLMHHSYNAGVVDSRWVRRATASSQVPGLIEELVGEKLA